jgi:L-amino acid N-acyltransferase YncA
VTAVATVRLPKTVGVKGADLALRFMTADDRAAILDFAGNLPEHDLLFLRRDITKPEAVDNWIRGIERGIITTVVADSEGSIAGYASIDRGEVDWSPHVAELRLLVSSDMRGKGLGRLLIQEALAHALSTGIEKIVAQATLDQKGAIASLEEVGFKAEALLKDHVKDRNGKKHDLVVFSHDVAGFQAELERYGVDEALAD